MVKDSSITNAATITHYQSPEYTIHVMHDNMVIKDEKKTESHEP